MHQKSQSYDVWFLRYGLRKTDFLSYWAIFALLSPNDPKYQNFEKMKKLPGDIILLHIHVHHKWRSYDIWFWNARCNRHIFCHFGSFFALLPPINLDNRNFEKMKNSERYYHFTNVYQKWQSFDGWILRYHGIIGVHSPPLNLGPPLITKLQVPLNLSGRTFSYFRPLYQYLYRTL